MTKVTLTVAEAAKLIGIDRNSVYALCRTEDFPSLQIGRRIIIPYDALMEWLQRKAAGM